MLLLYFIIFAVRLPLLQKMYLQDPFAKQPQSNTTPGRQPPESLFLILHENVTADKIRPAKMQKKEKKERLSSSACAKEGAFPF